jgi:5'-nucleotidase
MSLTGAQIKKVLEEQWSRDNIDNAHANIPARPFLKLGISQGFSYTYHEVPDPVHNGATLGVVDQMWLNGKLVDPATTYKVTVNSFLASGGDNFWELANGAQQRDTEQTDLQAQVDYMKQFQSDPLPVDYAQRAVRVTFPADAPSSYGAGDTVAFSLSSLIMTGPKDVQDTSVTVKDSGTVLADAVPVTANNSTQPYDNRGNASVSVQLPAGVAGDRVLKVYGNQTGALLARIRIPGVKADSTLTAEDQSATYGSAGSLTASIAGATDSGGQVTFSEGSTVLGTADVASDGTATLSLPEVTLGAGTHTITADFSNSDALNNSSTSFTLTVDQAATSVTADDLDGTVGTTALLPVTVTSSATAKPTGTVTVYDGLVAVGTGVLVDGSATVPVDTTAMTSGATDLSVVYGGADDFATSGTSVTLTLSKAASTVTAEDQTATYGAAGSLSVTVDASVPVSGTVTFSEGSTTLGQADVGADGTATLALSEVTLAAGAHTITTSYGGNEQLSTSSTTFTLTVAKASTTVVAGDVTAARGSSPEVAVTVTSDGGVPSGTVRVLDASNTEIGTGTLTNGAVAVVVDTASLVTGANTVTVSYLGAADFATSTRTITITITSTKKTATVTAADLSMTYGQGATLKISVTGVPGSPTPTGKVQVMYGTTSLGTVSLFAGHASFQLRAKILDPGDRALSLVYSGNAIYDPATGVANVGVARAAASISNYVQGGLVKVNKSGPKMAVTVSAVGVKPTGTVTLLIGGRSYVGTLSNGHVSILLPTFTSPGKVPVTINYSGSDYVGSATKSATVTVLAR